MWSEKQKFWSGPDISEDQLQVDAGGECDQGRGAVGGRLGWLRKDDGEVVCCSDGYDKMQKLVLDVGTEDTNSGYCK